MARKKWLDRMIACLASGCDSQACVNKCEVLNPYQPGRMSLRAIPLCTGLSSTLLSLAGSRHSHTLLLALGTKTKLLHHSDDSSTSNGTIISCFCSLSSFSVWLLWCICYSMHLVGAATFLHPQFEGMLKGPNSCKNMTEFILKSLCH